MVVEVNVREVAVGELEASAEPYSLRDTLRTYSFGWMYRGGDCGYVGLGEYCVARVCGESRIEYRVFCHGEPGFDPVEKLQFIIGVDEDVSDYLRVARGDPLVGGVVEVMPGHRVRAMSVWAALLTAVCQQNASFRQGWNMLYKLHLLASPRLRLPDGHVYLETPHPEHVDETVLRRAGLGYRARTVLEAKEAADIECSEVSSLIGIKGVGRYTVALVKILACRDYSMLPLDKWLLKLASKAYGLRESQNEVEMYMVKKFDRWVGLAAIHTTIGFDAQPLRRALERLETGLNKPGVDEPSPVTLWRYTPPP